jgi:hypothetical protein
MIFFGKTNEKKPITIETLAKAGLLDPQKASLTTEKHEKRQKSARLDFSRAKGLYTYLVITTSLMQIKPLQATKKGRLPAQNRLNQL